MSRDDGTALLCRHSALPREAAERCGAGAASPRGFGPCREVNLLANLKKTRTLAEVTGGKKTNREPP
jgi:hypothetical protein